MMAFHTIQSWTLCGLIGAFIDLALAYFLLCGSAFAFFASKFCNVFGLHLPCPCTGLFGYENRSMCLHRLLIEWPIRKIASVQMLIKSRFPFGLIWFQNQPGNVEMILNTDSNYVNRVIGFENEASSSSFSSLKLQNLVDRESGYDAKGKKIVNQKQRHAVRRKRRSALLYGKSSKQLAVAGGSSSAYNESDMRCQIDDCSNPVTGKEDALKDDANATNGLDLVERTWFEQTESYGKTKVKDDDSASFEKFMCDVEVKSGNAGSEENRIRMLESALEEEKVVCAALHLELEKERAAAATATDEAMSMISRLQADKAAIEMEARQYQRMIEEKFAYEEEEMDILKEILVRREKEKYFLEKEVEAYRQMKCLENEESEVDFSQMTSEWGQKPLNPLDPNEDSLVVPQEAEKSKSFNKNKVENGMKFSAAYDASSADITSEASQICNGIKSLSCSGDKLGKDVEYRTKVPDNLHCSTHDSEPFVYDVHVIDDKTELRKEDNCKESGLSSSVATDFRDSSGELLSNGANTRFAETNQNTRISFEMKDEAPVLGNSRSKNLLFDSDGDSSSAASSERLKLDTEVEFLRERLRKVQEGKEKLTFSADRREIINAQLKLVEEIVSHLGQILQLREPGRQTSLPPSSSKVSLKKRRCQSVRF